MLGNGLRWNDCCNAIYWLSDRDIGNYSCIYSHISFILNSLYYHVNIFIFIFYVSVFVVKN